VLCVRARLALSLCLFDALVLMTASHPTVPLYIFRARNYEIGPVTIQCTHEPASHACSDNVADCLNPLNRAPHCPSSTPQPTDEAQMWHATAHTSPFSRQYGQLSSAQLAHTPELAGGAGGSAATACTRGRRLRRHSWQEGLGAPPPQLVAARLCEPYTMGTLSITAPTSAIGHPALHSPCRPAPGTTTAGTLSFVGR
jgi:hypothetical protein